MKAIIITLVCICALITGFLIGDYQGLWKRTEITRLEIIQVRFKAIDSVTNQPVDNYHVRCRARGSNDLCVPVADALESPGVKTVRIAGQRKYEKGLLFSHDKGLAVNESAPVELWVIHADYRTLSLASSYTELTSLGTDMKELILTPR